jgi:hypothetical protein
MTLSLPESRSYQRDDGLSVFPRDEFASERLDYKPGQHVVFAGPTQRGKTELAKTILRYTATPALPAYVAVSKPADKASRDIINDLGFRRITSYPPPPKMRELMGEKPSGYVLWPDMRNPDNGMIIAATETRKLIRSVYADGAKGKQCILVLDDTVIKAKVLGLDTDMVMISTMSGAMGVGGWFFVQKPTDAGKIALWAFSQSEHIFITKDPDKRNRERYNEIGGFDTKQVNQVSQTLKPYQFLYLERTHGYMCIVDAK